MKLYNTLSKRKEEFVPIEEGKVRMYVCGPTVYNFIHIGNARPMIVFDTVRRYFEYKGYDVNFVSNFTDVDDKIIKKANEEGVTAEEISKRYIEECKKDMEGMNVKPATKNPLATEEIGAGTKWIQTLRTHVSVQQKRNKALHCYRFAGTIRPSKQHTSIQKIKFFLIIIPKIEQSNSVYLPFTIHLFLRFSKNLPDIFHRFFLLPV